IGVGGVIEQVKNRRANGAELDQSGKVLRRLPEQHVARRSGEQAGEQKIPDRFAGRQSASGQNEFQNAGGNHSRHGRAEKAPAGLRQSSTWRAEAASRPVNRKSRPASARHVLL